MAQDPIIVAGGGLGGLGAALGLAKKGKNVVVLEKAPELGEIGAGIQLGPNAFHSFDYLGVGKGARENREQEGFHLRLFHGITPATETTSYYFWSTANGYRTDDPQATEDMYNEIYPTFVEDVDIMNVQQERINLDPDRTLVGIKADKALVMARRALKEALDKEASFAQAAE